MLTVTILNNEYKELLKKATVYDIKKRELEFCGYVTENDRILFDIPKEEPTEEAKDDF